MVLLGCESQSGSGSTPAQSASSGPRVSTMTTLPAATQPSSQQMPSARSPAEASLPKVDLPEPLAPPDERPLATSDQAITSVFDAYGFPPRAKLAHFCKRRLIEAGAIRTTLDAFTSSEPPAALVAFYEKRLTKRGMHTEANETSWRLPADSPAPTRTLTITKPTAEGRHRLWCPKPSVQTGSSLLLLTRVD